MAAHSTSKVAEADSKRVQLNDDVIDHEEVVATHDQTSRERVSC